MKSILISRLIEFLNGDRSLWNTEESLSKCLFNFLKFEDNSFEYIDNYKIQLSDAIKQELTKYKNIDDNEIRKGFRFETNGNFVIFQPFGSQCSPDILVICNHRHFFIEHKSSNNGNIMWNSSYPIYGGCYIFHNKKENYTTFFTNNEMIIDSTIENIKEYVNVIAKVAKEFNLKMPSGSSFYPRFMYMDSTIYRLKNKSDDLCREQSALKYISEMV